MRSILFAFGVVLAACLPEPAMSQAWPAKPIRVIVPYPSGSNAEILFRVVVAKVAVGLGQPIVVEAKPGFDGNIGNQLVAKAPADGYTWLAIGGVSMLSQPALNRDRDLGYDPVRDLRIVSVLATSTNVLLATPNAPFNTVKELVAAAKTNPGKHTYAVALAGALSSLTIAKFRQSAGIDMLPVPYAGAPPAIVDVVGGRVDICVMPQPVALPQIAGKRMKALAVFDDVRNPVLPDVPTIVEAGYPDLVAKNWWSVHVPRDTPQPIVNRMREEFAKALTDPQVIQTFKENGVQPMTNQSLEAAEAFTKSEFDRWSRVIVDAGIKRE